MSTGTRDTAVEDASSHGWQSHFGDMISGAEWELQYHDQKQLDKTYCEHCSYAVGDDPEFFGVGGFLTGPFCTSECAWAWLNEKDSEGDGKC